MDFTESLLERLKLVLSSELFVIGKTSVTVWTVLFLVSTLSLLWFMTGRFAKWFLAKLSLLGIFDEVFNRRFALVARLLAWATGAIWIVDFANVNITAFQILGYLQSFFDSPFVHIGKTQITLWTIIYIVSLWVVLVITTNRLQSWCAATLLSRSGIEFGAGHAISVIVRYVVVSVGFVVILQSAGIDLSALTVLAGALGLGLSFGLQNITSNLVSGLIVLVESPIKVGDRIEVSGITGDVTKIALRATTICTNDNIEIIVPNSQFISGNVINWSHSSRDVRVCIPVGVSYNSDPEEVRNILLKVAGAHDGVLVDPAPSVIFKGFGDSSLEFVLRVFTRCYVSAPAMLQSDLNFAIFKEFKVHEIEMPFPQRDLHIRSALDLSGLLTGNNSADVGDHAETLSVER